jgi:hypothetical protein
LIGYGSPADATPGQVLAAADEMISGLIADALGHAGGPLAGACERSAGFQRAWWGPPPGPPFAPGG